VRHAEPSVRGVILGAADPVLSAQGHAQARALRLALAEMPVAALYVSPMRRALQTAAWLQEPWRPMAVLQDLCEIHYGPWDGLSWAEIEALDPELAARKAGDWLGVDVPGAEPWIAFRERVLRCLDRIRRGPLPAMVVAHQGVNAVMAEALLGTVPTEFQQNHAESISLRL
jgi:broad specificity phosphatase PhoE